MKDKLGIFFSGLCVLHCLIYTVLIVGGVSSTGFLRVSEEVLHPLLLIFVVIIGLISFPSSYVLHDNLWPMRLGIIGTIGLFFALFFTLFLLLQQISPSSCLNSLISRKSVFSPYKKCTYQKKSGGQYYY